jgi:GSH-dependent disulfide-bond oxidoreductase
MCGGGPYDPVGPRQGGLRQLPHLKRLVDEVEAKPAAQTALGLKGKFTWKTDLDDEARRNMFRHLAVKA